MRKGNPVVAERPKAGARIRRRKPGPISNGRRRRRSSEPVLPALRKSADAHELETALTLLATGWLWQSEFQKAELIFKELAGDFQKF